LNVSATKQLQKNYEKKIGPLKLNDNIINQINENKLKCLQQEKETVNQTSGEGTLTKEINCQENAVNQLSSGEFEEEIVNQSNRDNEKREKHDQK
jgi:CRISPR/Cas system-associated protein Csx1